MTVQTQEHVPEDWTGILASFPSKHNGSIKCRIHDADNQLVLISSWIRLLNLSLSLLNLFLFHNHLLQSYQRKQKQHLLGSGELQRKESKSNLINQEKKEPGKLRHKHFLTCRSYQESMNKEGERRQESSKRPPLLLLFFRWVYLCTVNCPRVRRRELGREREAKGESQHQQERVCVYIYIYKMLSCRHQESSKNVLKNVSIADAVAGKKQSEIGFMLSLCILYHERWTSIYWYIRTWLGCMDGWISQWLILPKATIRRDGDTCADACSSEFLWFFSPYLSTLFTYILIIKFVIGQDIYYSYESLSLSLPIALFTLFYCTNLKKKRRKFGERSGWDGKEAAEPMIAGKEPNMMWA